MRRDMISLNEGVASMREAKHQLSQCLRIRTDITDLGLYIHVPFCQKRCHFCAFYLTLYREGAVRDFLVALEQELALWGDTLGPVPLSTVYFGGGTPTCLTAEQLVRILDGITKTFHVVSDVEITVEATPDTVTKHGLKTLHLAGVNRLSLGAQSFVESEWEQLGRSGSILDTETAIEGARHMGFQNINVDLMYGLPDQTLESWEKSLMQAVKLDPTHVSCYALSIEQGTRFHFDQLQGHLNLGDSDLEGPMDGLAASYLAAAGFRHYEISNYCQPGYECRHNLRYWTSQNYLGFGPSAQSYVGPARFGNVESLTEYCRQLSQRNIPLASFETLSDHQVTRERVVFGLRLLKGCDLHFVKENAQDINWSATVIQLIKDGLLHNEGNTLRLTATGRRFADSVAVQLL